MPIFCIAFAGHHEVIVRILLLITILIIAVFLILYYALNPKTKMVKSGAKLHKLECNSRVISSISVFFRIFFFSLGLGILCILFQIGRDVIPLLKGSEVEVVEGNLIVNNTPLGIWFVHQGITLEGADGRKRNYSFFYSKRRLKRNIYYEFKILTHSGIVLQAREIDGNYTPNVLNQYD